jgi:prevent-host-death family protein
MAVPPRHAFPWTDLVADPEDTDGPKVPRKVSVRDLSRHLSRELARVMDESSPVVVTHRGSPAWVVLPLDPGKFTTFLLSGASGFLGAEEDIERAST